MFEAIDHLTANLIANTCESSDEDLKLFFASLAASYRQGSLFVEIEDRKLPESDLFVQRGNKVFLERAYTMLKEFEMLVQKVSASRTHLVMDEDRLKVQLEHASLLPEQASAIKEAAKNSLLCISGGPGTGKTYTAGWLVRFFLEQHPQARIMLTAPTGKAAGNLRESIQRQIGPSALEAKTLHALLGLKRMQKRQKLLELAYDLIIVDESSMIDLNLAVKLLRAVPEGARIIFLGDPFQLPPIEAGEPFVAMIEHKSAGRLVTTKRQENETIIHLAEYVREGNVEKALSCITLRPLDASFDPSIYVKQLYTQSVEAFFAALLQLRLLSPMREGPFGTISLNERMQQAAYKAAMQPILITKNDYNLNLSNGQVGVLFQGNAYFENYEEPSTFRRIPQVLLSSYEPAYALSVHKSQGSEFSEVVLILPEGSERFGRKMLYTAITRAKKKLTIYSSHATLQACILSPGRPLTTILPLP